MNTDFCKHQQLRVSCWLGWMALLPAVLSAQTVTPFASGLGTPTAGVVLTGTAISPTTGQPVRHLWSGDNDNGFCRLDPDVDTPGSHTINTKGGTITCGTNSLGVGQTMVVTVNVSVPVGGLFTVTGAATFNGSDTNPANNSFPVTTQVK